MVREVVTIQVGQCGNQVGWRFWDLVLREHVQQNRAGLFDDALSSFFRNVDTRYAEHGESCARVDVHAWLGRHARL